MLSSNLSWNTSYPDWGFCGLPQSLQENAGMAFWLGHDHFLPHPFKYIIHHWPHHLTLYCVRYWQRSKIKHKRIHTQQFFQNYRTPLVNLTHTKCCQSQICGILALLPGTRTPHIFNSFLNNTTCNFIRKLWFLEITDKLPYRAQWVGSVPTKMAWGCFSRSTSVFLPNNHSTNAPCPSIIWDWCNRPIWGCTELSCSYRNKIKNDYDHVGRDV
jgi:hypothetical protein